MVERPHANGDSSSSTAESFRLSGPSPALDPQVHAYRRDLADIILAGRVIAPHYARPVTRSCGAQPAMIRSSPDGDSEPLSQLLPGEIFSVLEYAGGWAWGYSEGDHLVGYVEAIELVDCREPTHLVCEKCAPVAADDRITSPVLAKLPMGARLRGVEHGACLTTEYGCVSMAHLRAIDEPEQDPASVAERLIHIPWRAGGRTFEGVDGPGLIHLALGLCGVDAPRIAEGQRQLGEKLPPTARLRRNDLVLSDHVSGLMLDDLMMIHACQKAGKVCVEPVALHNGPGLERRRLPI